MTGANLRKSFKSSQNSTANLAPASAGDFVFAESVHHVAVSAFQRSFFALTVSHEQRHLGETSRVRIPPGPSSKRMTAPARITRADMDRVFRSLKVAGIENARIVLRLEKAEIEVIIGESAKYDELGPNPFDEWTDDDF